MTIFKHELRLGRLSLIIWTGAIAFLTVICVLMFPEMKSEMDSVSNLFASMGSFSAAFGMDKLNFGTLVGFYSVECGNILGLGGAFFASLLAVTALAKEEKDRTVEFLLSHPVSRFRVITEKLISVFLQIVILNLVVLVLSMGAMRLTGEEIPYREILLIHTAYFILQLELAGICFGISAFLNRGGMGIGIGIASVLYFLNLIANMTDQGKFLKYITPFGYCEGSDIVANQTLDVRMTGIGVVFMLIGVSAAYWQYSRKDMQ